MLMAGRDEKIVTALSKILGAVENHRHEIVVDENDLGTELDFAGGYQATLDDKLKRWNSDAVGQALREGIRRLGELFVPLATRSEVDKIVEEVVRRAPDPSRASAIIDHMFDGLTSRDEFTFRA